MSGAVWWTSSGSVKGYLGLAPRDWHVEEEARYWQRKEAAAECYADRWAV